METVSGIFKKILLTPSDSLKLIERMISGVSLLTLEPYAESFQNFQIMTYAFLFTNT